jgi:hypothetical protein
MRAVVCLAVLCVLLFSFSLTASAQPIGVTPGIALTSTFRLGYLDHYEGYFLAVNAPDGNQTAKTPLRGAWLELELGAHPSEYTGVGLTGGLLLPGGTTGLASHQPPDPFDSPPDISAYGTDIEWWLLDLRGSYEVAGTCLAIGGFRWDHMNTRFGSERPPFNATLGQGGVSVDLPDGFANFKFNAWFPYVGIQYQHTAPENSVTVRLIGFPMVFGEVKQQSVIPAWDVFVFPTVVTGLGGSASAAAFNSGRFLEFFAEYSFNVIGSGTLGLFAKWNLLEVTTGPAEIDSSVNLGGTNFYGQTPVDFNYRKTSWTLGGSFSMEFGFPYW